MKFNQLFAATMLTTACLTAQGYDQVVVFGDSLTDNGNLAAAVPNQAPPAFYAGGRFSNGLLGIEYLTQAITGQPLKPSHYLQGLNEGTNYSVAGSRLYQYQQPQSLDGQVNAFLAFNGQIADQQNLYFISMGGNDIRDAYKASDEAEGLHIIESALDNLERNILTLIKKGATDIMVQNSTDVGKTPEAQYLTTAEAPKAELASHFSQLYSQGVKELVERLNQVDGTRIVLVDIQGYVETLFQSGDALGYENRNDYCVSLFLQKANPECGVGFQNVDRFFFFDDIHPTKSVHQRVGSYYLSLVPQLP